MIKNKGGETSKVYAKNKLQDEDLKIKGKWKVEPDDKLYLEGCAVGTVKSLDSMETITQICKSGSIGIQEAKLIGGCQVLLKMENEEILKQTIQNKNHGIHFWVKDLRKWSVAIRNTQRLAWIKISGIPL